MTRTSQKQMLGDVPEATPRGQGMRRAEEV
jgi:hypothetical protein